MLERKASTPKNQRTGIPSLHRIYWTKRYTLIQPASNNYTGWQRNNGVVQAVNLVSTHRSVSQHRIIWNKIQTSARYIHPLPLFPANVSFAANYWVNEGNRKKYFLEFAQEHQFDPSVPDNWYTLHIREALNKQVTSQSNIRIRILRFSTGSRANIRIL